MNEYGIGGILIAIKRVINTVGRGGDTTAAKAILDMLNKGRRRKLKFAA